jgi:hypothetical protein
LICLAAVALAFWATYDPVATFFVCLILFGLLIFSLAWLAISVVKRRWRNAAGFAIRTIMVALPPALMRSEVRSHWLAPLKMRLFPRRYADCAQHGIRFAGGSKLAICDRRDLDHWDRDEVTLFDTSDEVIHGSQSRAWKEATCALRPSAFGVLHFSALPMQNHFYQVIFDFNHPVMAGEVWPKCLGQLPSSLWPSSPAKS